jgi:hypothetical protein
MRIRPLVLAAVTALCVAGMASAQTIGSGFTYQGTFADNGVPANGSYDFEFALYNVASGGTAAQTVTQSAVAVSGGLINTTMDFGAATFDGSVKWVEVHVRPAGSGGSYTVLAPRQALSAVPYALGLPMPFQRTVATGATSAFRIAAADGGTSIEGYNPTESDFPAIFGLSAGAVGVRGSGDQTGVEGNSFSVGVNGTGGSAGVRGVSDVGDGVRGLGFYGVHGVGQLLGVWAEGGLLATGSNSCNLAGTCGTGVSPILDVRNDTIGNLIVARAGTPSSDVFRVNGNGSVFANGDYNAGGADVAEYVPASEALAPGDVVEIDATNGEAFRLSSRSNSTTVAGVISTRPGVSLNASTAGHEPTEGLPRLALSGRVPVKATSENGAIRAGDLLVSSSQPGHAMRAPESPRAGTVIGKAMKDLDGDNGEIEMLVMLR